MGFVSAKDGTQIFYKDWGPKDATPIVFHHGWPLSADDWDAQMMFFLLKGYRVIAHDRRGHGRSTQTWQGNEMDTYAADVIALTDALDLKGAIHVGHSTGGGEVIHYIARHGQDNVAKGVLISAVPPLMVPTNAGSALRMPQLAPTDSDESKLPSISPMLKSLAKASGAMVAATATASRCG